MPKPTPRYVVLLPPGVGRDLVYDHAGVELGNGWFDVTARVTADDVAGDWYPIMTFRPSTMTGTPDQVLCDGDRSPTEPLRAGTIVRDSRTVSRRRKAPPPAYWLFDGARWRLVTTIYPDRRPRPQG